MNKQRQIEELAKIEGYTRERFERWGLRWVDPAGGILLNSGLPYYLTSHDAIQRVIDGLTDEQLIICGTVLTELTKTEDGRLTGWVGLCRASASQWAEAVLKALGKWEEQV